MGHMLYTPHYRTDIRYTQCKIARNLQLSNSEGDTL